MNPEIVLQLGLFLFAVYIGYMIVTHDKKFKKKGAEE